MEGTAGAWLKDIFGLPAGASFALVTGCQMAHATYLAAARHTVLAKCGWDVEKQGFIRRSVDFAIGRRRNRMKNGWWMRCGGCYRLPLRDLKCQTDWSRRLVTCKRAAFLSP
jgi:hypothetical protein